MTFADDSILVLLDVTPAGELAKSSAGLLGAAASVGTPVALVVVGRRGARDGCRAPWARHPSWSLLPATG